LYLFLFDIAFLLAANYYLEPVWDESNPFELKMVAVLLYCADDLDAHGRVKHVLQPKPPKKDPFDTWRDETIYEHPPVVCRIELNLLLFAYYFSLSRFSFIHCLFVSI
jgi:hypothetical protein